MTETRRKTSDRARSQRRQGSLFDYVFVVRRHWLLSSLAFLLTILGVLLWVLHEDPVYESFTTIRLEDAAGAESVLDELAAFEKPSSLEAEMTVMTSNRVAEAAAEHAGAHPTAIIYEQNGYRPLEVLLRSLRGAPGPAVLDVETPASAEGTEAYVFSFGPEGKRLTARRSDEEGAGVTVADFEMGRPFEAFGRTFTLTHVRGDVSGRTFEAVIRSRDVAAAWIRGGTFVDEVSERTGIVSLGFRARTPELARAVADALRDSYLTLNKQQQDERLKKVVGFLKGEIDKLGKSLSDLQTERDAYIQANDAHQLAGAAKDARAQLTEARSRRAERKRALSAKRWELDGWTRESSLEERLVLLGSETTDPMTLSVATEYANLQRQIKILLAPGPERETADSPRVLKLQQQLNAAGEQLTKRIAVVAAARTARIERDIEDIEAEIAELDTLIERYTNELRRIPAIETKLAEFQREVESTKDLLQTLIARHIEAEIAQASMEMKQSEVDKAFLPGGRKSPRLFRMGLLGIALGLIFAFAVAILRDVANRNVRSPGEIEAELGLQVFATIPHYRLMRRRHRRRLKRGLVMLEAPDSVVAEAYRSLRANIRFGSETPIKTLAITSAGQSEGKTVTALNLAIAMARSGATAIVIDADLRRSKIHHQMNCPRAPGLVDVLTSDVDWKTVVRESEVDGLAILTAGKKTDEPGRLLDSDAFRELLTQLKDAYDHVLLDVPPVLAVADAASFFRQLDGVLLLARDQSAPLASVEGALRQVERLGGKVLGTVYNAYDPRGGRERRYGYYGYYGYYGRGHGYRDYESKDE